MKSNRFVTNMSEEGDFTDEEEKIEKARGTIVRALRRNVWVQRRRLVKNMVDLGPPCNRHYVSMYIDHFSLPQLRESVAWLPLEMRASRMRSY